MKWWKEQGPGVSSSPSSAERPWDPEPSDPASPWLGFLTGPLTAPCRAVCVCPAGGVGCMQ